MMTTPDQHQPDSGPREIRTLPPMRLRSGPEWRMPADLAAAFIQAVYARFPDQAAKAMTIAMTGEDHGRGRQQ